jgi:hypothetical protein
MLESIAPELWAAESEIRFAGGVVFPLRTTIARLPGGALLLYSPIKPDDALAAEVAALGEVAHLVAPNRFHHLYLRRWKERFPGARVHGPPGLAEKRPDLAFDSVLGADSDFAGAFDVVPIGGAPRASEVALVHRPTGTLLVGDLLFNIVEPRTGATRFALTVVGTRARLGHSRLWTFLRRDRAAFRGSVERLLALPFDRLVPCHGAIIERGAHAQVAEALAPTRGRVAA